MFLIDVKIIVRRYLPPHWQGTGREWLIAAVVQPLIALYADFSAYRKSILRSVNLNSQTIVLEHHLNSVFGVQAMISVGDGDFDNEDFVVFVHYLSAGSVAEINREVNKYKLAGKRFRIELYGN